MQGWTINWNISKISIWCHIQITASWWNLTAYHNRWSKNHIIFAFLFFFFFSGMNELPNIPAPIKMVTHISLKVTAAGRFVSGGLVSSGMSTFCSGSMKCERLKSVVRSLRCGLSLHDYSYRNSGVKVEGSREHREAKNGSIKSGRTWTFTDVKQQYRPVRRFRLEGSGNAVVFVLSEHFVSSWFSMLVEEWGLRRPPLLKVFHRGESSDVHGIQRVCRFCLWRRWNIVFCFTTIRLIDIADLNWV